MEFLQKNISVIIIRLGGIYGNDRKIKSSKNYRRLVQHDNALNYIKASISRFGENDCINGFMEMIL